MCINLEYHSLVRKDALRIFPQGQFNQVLEVGCGTGATLGYMKQQGMANHTTGIEFEGECAQHKHPEVDTYLTGNAEEYDFSCRYDAVLLLDVLEHLKEPFALLQKISKCLNSNGYVLISIPNIRNFNVLRSLVHQGLWEYSASGILDRGHLRFFTYTSFLRSALQNVPELKLVKYASNDEEHGFPWNLLFSFPRYRELKVCQHLFLFQLDGPGR